MIIIIQIHRALSSTELIPEYQPHCDAAHNQVDQICRHRRKNRMSGVLDSYGSVIDSDCIKGGFSGTLYYTCHSAYKTVRSVLRKNRFQHGQENRFPKSAEATLMAIPLPEHE